MDGERKVVSEKDKPGLLKRLMRAGWTIVKVIACGAAGVLLVLKAPVWASIVAGIPVVAKVAEMTKGDFMLMMFSAAATSIVASILAYAAPEALAVLCALGVWEMSKRLKRAIEIREEVKRRQEAQAA